jgi:hypothetical protein
MVCSIDYEITNIKMNADAVNQLRKFKYVVYLQKMEK